MGDDPGSLVVAGVEEVPRPARTWDHWNGRPIMTSDRSRLNTPNKAIRRHVDHMADRLAEVECLLAGIAPPPDHWLASEVTPDADPALSALSDLNEATERSRRLARIFGVRLETAGVDAWDRSRQPSWTLREIAEHVPLPWCAEQVGDPIPDL